ncbi:4Fe-4S binding protein [candidate division KSB1 bacterium]|nr:MAG: 4Fe-4S binding protein [candidate division KSB1 bacterium]
MKKTILRNRLFRYGILTVVLVLVVRLSLGFGQRSFENFCPFGGMESLWGLITTKEFSCSLGPLNLSILIAVLILAIIAKKAFCGWACPIGFLSELAGRLGGLIWKKRPRPDPKVNRAAKLLRYVVLVAALYFTYKAGELILRGYDPYFLIFSRFGHGSLGTVSWIVLGALLVGAFAVPMFFCRYLCPLSATFDPFARLGVIKVVRNEHKCTDCGLCEKACPHDIAPQKMIKVVHHDCTNCLECVDVCPVKGALELKATL